jgi:hypothetical protein
MKFGMVAGILCLAAHVEAASPVPLPGAILGQVKNGAGVSQMGATILLYNRYDQLVRQALTDEQGKFVFEKLGPDLYSIRVTLASFVPALRRNIAVAAGSDSVLQINLSTLLSSVDLVGSVPSRGTLMSDDWKWVLRTSQSTRPVLRLLPDKTSSSTPSTATVFSNTTGLVRLSAGGESANTGSPQDLGTAFALATSIYGSGRVQFSGNLGYAASSGVPAGGFRTSYRARDGGTGPAVTLTVRQLYLPNAADNAPALRTMSLALLDKFDLTDSMHLEYGARLESVSFVQRLNYLSPFARATYDLDSKSSLRFGFSTGTEPNELAGAGSELGTDLGQDLTALAQLPRISRRDFQAQVQRTKTFEAGYRRVQGSRTYAAAAYRESVSNAAFIMSGPSDFVPVSDSLPDFGTRSRIFNTGNYQDLGYMAAVTQSLGDHMEASLAAGRGAALVAGGGEAQSNDPNEVRGLIRQTQRPWVTMRLSGTVPVTGSRLSTDYGWTDIHAVVPVHEFLTLQSDAQAFYQQTGWNVHLRQPLPAFGGMPGRLEATVDLQNLLAQGYLPVTAAGRRTLLTNSPRAVRGSLSFIF